MPRGSLFRIAILYHPTPTKEQAERNEIPKSEILVEPKHVLAADANQAATLGARMIPDTHVEKLDQVQVLVGPF